ncbi:MAG: DUF3604 domain-containing protein, partial [Silicimonas sp.]|nr:DUF3604 domain-containing protein [Silicimonas sp.]
MPVAALAQYHEPPDPEVMEKLYPGKTYSPYAERSFPSHVFWGETHLHTGLSLDAGLWGNTLGHADAYRFARGEEVTSSTGLPARLGRPLDWLAITDHSDTMGLATGIQEGAPNILADPQGREWAAAFARGGRDANEAALDLISSFTQGTMSKKLLEDYSPGSAVYNSLWDDIIETADQFNDPGRFATLI